MAKLVPVSIVIFLKKPSNNSITFWVQPRETEGSLKGLLEFPGGKIEAGESPVDAAIREVHEEVGLEITHKENLNHFKIHSYQFEGKNISLYVYLYNIKDSVPLLDKIGKWVEVDFEEKSKKLRGLIPPVNHIIIDELVEYIKKENYGID